MMGNLSLDPSSSDAAATIAPSSASSGSFAFLVHSQDTLTNKLPPTVENKPVARQRRKRTSPEDQAILEAEYLKNPKPDREARMEIVGRVALGEKELQIWFQNRRQNARKKTVSTLPDAVDEPTLHSASSDPNESFSFSSSFASTSSSLSSEDTVIEHSATTSCNEDTTHGVNKSPLGSQGTNEDVVPGDSNEGVNTLRSPPSAFSSDSFSNKAWSTEDKISKIRLSWSLDGKVKIATKEDGSPPRPSPFKPISRIGLQRSYSANTAGNIDLDMDPFNLPPRSKANRRSKNNNAWAILGSAAGADDEEENGSAAAAIKALRTRTDSTRIVGTKRGTQGQAESPTKKAKPGPSIVHSSSAAIKAKVTGPKAPKPVNARVPLLSRANSSMAKLSSEKKKKIDMEDDDNDSDKENWHCGGTQPLSRRRRQRRPFGPQRPQKPTGRGLNLQIYEDPETEPEKEGGGEDLDAVQNLLSLSQGQWK